MLELPSLPALVIALALTVIIEITYASGIATSLWSFVWGKGYLIEVTESTIVLRPGCTKTLSAVRVTRGYNSYSIPTWVDIVWNPDAPNKFRCSVWATSKKKAKDEVLHAIFTFKNNSQRYITFEREKWNRELEEASKPAPRTYLLDYTTQREMKVHKC